MKKAAKLRKYLDPRLWMQGVHLLFWRTLVPWRLKGKGVTCHSSARFYGSPIVSLAVRSTIRIGARSTLISDSRYTALGVNHSVVLRTLSAGANIEIGDDTGISGGSICASKEIKIGAQCLIGANVMICDTDFHSLNPAGRRYPENELALSALPVIIEDNVFIGTNSMILKGVTIGANSVIGAGSVVTKNVPRDSVFGGNPAKGIGQISRLTEAAKIECPNEYSADNFYDSRYL